MTTDYDVCVIGSGAGGGPVAYELAKAGYAVVVLEKGPWYTEKDFYKDEIACCRRNAYASNTLDEPQVVESHEERDAWWARSTYQSGWTFWNGNCVGGSSNFMSGYFHRLKPMDFRLLSEFGPIEGANIVDWPISYEDMEPYYDKVERVVGVSGRVHKHRYAEPRSSEQFAYPATVDHPMGRHIEAACDALGMDAITAPRAILSRPKGRRRGCNYSGYCGSYGCATSAKGSSRAALLNDAVETGNCDVRPHAMVSRLISDAKGKVIAAEYFDADGKVQRVTAKIFNVACQAVESARLLLRSTGPRYPQGLANDSGQVGRNLIFAAGGAASGRVTYEKFGQELASFGPFINRAVQDYYVIDDKDFGPRQKGGTIDFDFQPPSAIARASYLVTDSNGLVWGERLKQRLEQHFLRGQYIKVEAFCDWLPIDDCHIRLSSHQKDKWGLPVSHVKVDYHAHNLRTGWYLADKGGSVLREMGAEDVTAFAVGSPPTNLQAGTCRFGDDAESSVLDADCRSHEAENLFVSDGSFMPNGGSVQHTWTIYANAFRVADNIRAQLGGGVRTSSQAQTRRFSQPMQWRPIKAANGDTQS
ncbi:MAG TPA: oxidoreductase [Gammaproteobacteria bacterium]|jgi:choline dehydrogenase-like flavoprotein|nr:oxidoreductase [Gammaproteobacteria bacterium]